MSRKLLAAILGATFSTAAVGQSINIDYGDRAGTPERTYAAAGLPGVWNNLRGEPRVSEPLVDRHGNSTAATIVQSLAFPDLFNNDPGTSGNDERLLDDYISGPGDILFSIVVSDLSLGRYQIITYAWGPAIPSSTTFVFVEGAAEPVQVIGGAWPGALEAGVTHAVHNTTVGRGTVTIEVVGSFGGSDSFVNGLQIHKLILGDLNGDGCVGLADLGMLLAEFGCTAPPGPCGGDLDGDGDVDLADLAILLANFGNGCA